jgi:hypothetical protein
VPGQKTLNGKPPGRESEANEQEKVAGDEGVDEIPVGPEAVSENEPVVEDEPAAEYRDIPTEETTTEEGSAEVPPAEGAVTEQLQDLALEPAGADHVADQEEEEEDDDEEGWISKLYRY